MRKIIIVIFTLVSFNSFAQFATFEPIIASPPTSSSGTYSGEVGEVSRTTGYILNESGSVKSKIQLKVSVKTTQFGESVSIVSYYNINPGFGANWEKVTVKAQAIGGQSPITKQQEVAYANFMYWAYWNSDKIWFNL